MAINKIENEIPPNASLVQWAKKFLKENTSHTAGKIAMAKAGLKKNEALRVKNKELLDWNISGPLTSLWVRDPSKYEDAYNKCMSEFNSFFNNLNKENEKWNQIIALAEEYKYALDIMHRLKLAEKITERSKPVAPVRENRPIIMPPRDSYSSLVGKQIYNTTQRQL